MTRPSITVILSCLFMIYILNDLWSLARLFIPPKCSDDSSNTCLESYLTSKPTLQLFLYTSSNVNIKNLNLIYHNKGFDYTQPFNKVLEINLPKETTQNGSLVLTVALLDKIHTLKKNWDELKFLDNAAVERIYITKYAKPQAKTFNLLGSDKEKSNTKEENVKPVTHLKSKVKFNVFADDVKLSTKELPPELVRLIRLNKQNKYLPILQYNFLESRLDDLVLITPKTTSLNVTFSYAPIGIGKLRLLLHLEQSMKQLYNLGFTEKDVDSVKDLFAESNLYVLCLTVLIGGVHLLFDILAFKNDVSFWRNKKSLAGLSPRSVLWRSFSHAVIFLYLLDENTSLLVLIPSAIGTLIEFWKATKIFKISFKLGFPCIKFTLKANNDDERITYKYDAECMKYLSYVLYPLCICGAVYSLLYEPHKGWYSWTINSMVNGVYAFGFIFMLPQLFVNYRLKSVSALPWRAFMYKAFNTFIDDIFAFIITMPTAHRVACFRDDIIFIIYLYQRWLYPIDYSRVDDPDVQALGPQKPKEIEDKKKQE
ncbi:cleft lip and palate transmembrane protein 1-like protein isoform X2 [Chrysoperla carnea]|uniref:cleft lip and palate transmembrane protein 1-like protein isoform X2 n=1 Tax=Chrysoperla carnea TaxID=189513 RepID=UPI001D073514|nr:cleft lip and palate transmembrane protein 1-like protein isoform X2 [Chrysoperla carnea]